MSTMRLTIALSAFLVHIEAHVCLPGKPPYTTTKFHLQVYRRLLTITRMKSKSPGAAAAARGSCSCWTMPLRQRLVTPASGLVMPWWR